jgi:Domain of unknown function (DUF4388)
MVSGEPSPSAEGSLSERDLPDLVQELSRLRWTGVLALERMGVDVRLNFKDGGMVFASSSDPDRRLGSQLFRTGALTLRQLMDAGKAVAPGKRLGTILVEQGVLAPKALVRAVVEQTQEIIYSAFQWTDGRYRLQAGAEAAESITLNISTPSIIFEGIRRIESWSRIDRAVGGLEARYVRCPVNDRPDATMRQMALEAEPLALLDALGKVKDVETLCASSTMRDFVVCRTLWAFRVIGLIRRVSAVQLLDDDGLEYVIADSDSS